MSEPLIEQLVELRRYRGMSQLDVAEAAWCDLKAIDDLEDGDGYLRVVVPVAHALGAALQVVGEDGEVLTNLGWSMASLPVTRSEGNVLQAVTHLAEVAGHRRSGAALCHVEVGNHYRAAVEELWGRPMGVHERWREMPLISGLQVSLTPHLGDLAQLVRTRPWRKASRVLSQTHVAPAALSPEQQEAYRVLRKDGVEEDEAAAVAAVM